MTHRPSLAPGYWTLLLLLLVCLPRVSIDAYLPALPAVADALHASDAQLQLSLTLYMFGYALSMLFSGPLCDRFGRRPVLLWSTGLYLLATLGCALASSVEMLMAARLLQAVGGCGTVVGRVMIRDRFDLPRQTRLLSLLSTAMALSPMLAPLAGSMITAWFGWRGIFAVLALTAGALLLMGLRLPETRPAPTGAPAQPVWRAYGRLLRNRYFMRYALAISLLFCTYFPFVLESSSLLQRGLGLSGVQYALAFAMSVSGYLLGTLLFRQVAPRVTHDRVIGWAMGVNLCGATLLALATALWPGTLWAILLPMVLILFSVGLAIPACQLAVLQPFAAIAGTASGLFFFLQMACTAMWGLLTGWLSDGSTLALVSMTLLASLGFVVLPWLLRAPTDAKGPIALGYAPSIPTTET